MHHELAQERDAVHAGHFDVEGDHVGLEHDDLVPRHVGVGRRPHDLDVGVLRELLREDLPDDGRIVDDENFDLVQTR